MGALSRCRRILGALLILLVPLLLLPHHSAKWSKDAILHPSTIRQLVPDGPSNLSPRHLAKVFGHQEHTSSRPSITDHQPLSDGQADASLQDVAPFFGHSEHNSSRLSLSQSSLHIHSKRALPARWEDLICRGSVFWNLAIKPAFQGNNPFITPDFGQNPFADSGWVFDAVNNVEDYDLPGDWDGFLDALPGGTPGDGDIWSARMEQTETYTSQQNLPNMPPTLANYHGNMIPRSGVIVMTSRHNPAFRLGERRIPPDQIERQLPRLHQSSDGVWEMWKRVPGGTVNPNPGSLRFFAVDYIQTFQTSTLINDIFQLWRHRLDVEWEERLIFDIDSEEGRALLGTANANAVVWLLIHHAAELGPRTLQVTLFTRGFNKQCMIWELIPEGGHGSLGEVDRFPAP